MEDLILGIDLGTTNSMASWVGKDGAEVLKNKSESTIIPSMVTILEDQILVGSESQAKRLEYPNVSFYSIKRFMGRGGSDIREELSDLPFKVQIDEKDRILLEGENRYLSPEQASAEILKEIKKKSELILGQVISKAVITVPAYFDDGQRQATRDAALIAGLEPVRIINEPTAAAIAYGLDEKKQGKIVVFDFGGGTFDVSVLELKGKLFKVLSTHGNSHLGGDDIDQLISDQLVHLLGIKNKNELTPDALQGLKLEAEAVKLELSSSLEVDKKIQIPGYPEQKVSFTREEFDELIKPILDQAIEHVELALQDAKLSKEDIDDIVMVGGTTKIPQVRERVREFFDQQPHVKINPDTVVAIGAGIQGHLLAGKRRDFLLMDIIPLSLGLETIGGTFEKLIMKNASIPAKATESFSTSVDNQTGVEITIYQGEREFVKHCRKLGKFILKGIPPMAAGLPRVEVTFLVDANGVLKVSAKELRSNQAAEIEVIPSYGLSQNEVRQAIHDSIEHAEEDFNSRNLQEFTTKGQIIIKSLEKVWDQLDQYLSQDQIDHITQLKKELEEAMKQDDLMVLKQLIDQMGDATRDLADDMIGNAILNTLNN